MSQFVEENLIRELADEAVRELNACREAGLKDRAKETAKRLLGRGGHRKDDIFWPAGLLMLGLWEAGRIQELEEYLQPWLEHKTGAVYVDDALSGYVFLNLYEKTANVAYKDAADRIAGYLHTAKKDRSGSIVYNQERPQNYIFADGAGQTSLFLSRYGVLFEKPEDVALARTQIVNFLQQGMDASTGLPYHGYDPESGLRYGIIGWGRAAGWLMMGMAGYVQSVPSDREMAQALASLTNHIMQWQRRDRVFSWQLQALDGPADTSATGMIFWSLMHAYAGSDQTDAVADGAAALKGYINGGKVYGASAECIDFSMYRQQYGNYPWGQGAVLAFLSKS